MAFEIELKFIQVNHALLREKLSVLGGVCKGRHLERNIVFDSPDREMKAAGELLRLRTKQWKDRNETVLTLKLPPKGDIPEDVKIYDERETKVESFEGTCGILEGLGYDGAFRYDKMREEWVLDGVEICLDELSFDTVVELEGARDAIFSVAQKLALPMENSSTATYHELHRAYRDQNNLAPQDSFYFTEEECQRLLNSL
ncbi:class IV adenylate cyclase [Halodesulfovibrio spirochaetisodalis]|uniref:Adenylate cyclase n=1 Tax=Halodesulfovibrio spirochaetisodalis TaxID=1560234 RepID=A0A1B7X9M2_9BACT|nr:class IV adenylate cyclase [Halodesulfovibrio spirochaetisodalis]OBQ46046.1 adenylate cyclase [Halodesulfovibrio spirochaetisodalis]